MQTLKLALPALRLPRPEARHWLASFVLATMIGLYAIAGLSVKHRFHEKFRYQNSITFFQNITDAGEFRVMMDATFSVDVTKRVGMFMTFGDRFNNDPLTGSKRNDFLFTTGMKWNFGRTKR